ncbi:hypothetical protein GALMADRAFT_1352202 [Galerina marginata CBS 339.88]|uniref:Uncharacterized protein n=1 Tax=Galerina marginata (strain CBS 339.88) TaxID=685588 RepID=A0A067SS63_GALM3|nr:hypothetical protein GALMADRAFT_1352202 [Galerina marginata CBS 339.88]
MPPPALALAPALAPPVPALLLLFLLSSGPHYQEPILRVLLLLALSLAVGASVNCCSRRFWFFLFAYILSYLPRMQLSNPPTPDNFVVTRQAYSPHGVESSGIVNVTTDIGVSRAHAHQPEQRPERRTGARCNQASACEFARGFARACVPARVQDSACASAAAAARRAQPRRRRAASVFSVLFFPPSLPSSRRRPASGLVLVLVLNLDARRSCSCSRRSGIGKRRRPHPQTSCLQPAASAFRLPSGLLVEVVLMLLLVLALELATAQARTKASIGTWTNFILSLLINYTFTSAKSLSTMLANLLIRVGIMSPPKIVFHGLDSDEMLVRHPLSQFYTSLSESNPIPSQQTLGRTIEHGRYYSEPEDVPVPIHHDIRLILRNFQGIVYVVDPTDNDSLRRSKEEIEDIVNDKDISQPILILLPFLDGSGNPMEEEVSGECDLRDILANGNGRVALFLYSLSSTELSGFMEGFSWVWKGF